MNDRIPSSFLLPEGEGTRPKGSPSTWLAQLAVECARTSQAKVAKRLGVSSAMVNQVLRGRYTGNIARLKTRFEGEYLGRTVACPVLGEISACACIQYQSRPFAATNATRVRLYRACHGGCPHSTIDKDEEQ
jgi:hypothetical protein